MIDFSQQPYLDSYNILRVRHKKEVSLIKEFREDFATLPGVNHKRDKSLMEQKRDRFYGWIDKTSTYVENLQNLPNVDWESEVAKEWIDYRVQHIRQAEAKNVKNLK